MNKTIKSELVYPWNQLKSRNSLQLVSDIERLIGSGILQGGEPLPSERDLAAGLELARNTVRAALFELREEGLIQGNSTRLRHVTRQPVQGRLAHTVAILDNAEIDLTTAIRQPGWPTYTHVAAMARIQALGFNAFSSVVNSVEPMTTLNRIKRLHPLGVILPFDCANTANSRQLIEALRQTEIPLACHSDLVGTDAAGDWVCTSHFEGGKLIAEYLLRRGCRRPLRLYRFPEQSGWLRERDRGFEQTMREAGIPEEDTPLLHTPNIITDPKLNEKEKFDYVCRSLVGYALPYLNEKIPIDALVAVTDHDAFQLGEMCRLMNRKLPVVGYDNDWEQSPSRQFSDAAPVASIDKRFDRIGRELIDLLFARINGELPAEPQILTIHPELVETDVPSRFGEVYKATVSAN